ncbi:MAG: CBS domain-containing protein [Candidatus Eremiobacteraeota bacterium]|nr:CBS domain-containing protein [Candidatus Eremiobacteraeota bacterium]
MELAEAYVSELCGRPVELRSQSRRIRIGKVEDVAVAGGTEETFPAVSGIYVRERDNIVRYAPYSTVEAISDFAVVLNVAPVEVQTAAHPVGELLLNKELLDKQIVDVDGRKVVRVNDVKLAPAGDSLRVIAADVGLSGLLRRIGLRGLGQRWLQRAARPGLRPSLIPWTAVQPLHRDLGSDAIRLRVPQDRIQRIHPVDLAAIIEDLNASDQASLVGSLDDETAADAFGELDVDTQLSILEDLKPDRAADIIEHMEPDDAADLLGEVDPDRQRELLNLMEPDEAQDVRELLGHGERTAGGLMTTEYLWVPPDIVVAEVFDHVRKAAADAELVYYLYVLEADERLIGVLSLRDLIVAEPQTHVRRIMLDDIVTVTLDASSEEVAATIARYDFVAVPVVDGDGRMQGIVTVDDAMDVLLPEKLRRMLPRVGKSRARAQS